MRWSRDLDVEIVRLGFLFVVILVTNVSSQSTADPEVQLLNQTSENSNYTGTECPAVDTAAECAKLEEKSLTFTLPGLCQLGQKCMDAKPNVTSIWKSLRTKWQPFIDTGNFGHLMSGAEMLDEYCSLYTAATECSEKCSFAATSGYYALIKQPFQFICDKKKDDFVKYVDCFQMISNSSEGVTKCTTECGSIVFEDFYQIPFDFDSMIGEEGWLAQKCSKINCYSSCLHDVFDDVCGTEKPAKLLDGIISLTIRKVAAILLDLNLEEHFPSDCRDLASLYRRHGFMFYITIALVCLTMVASCYGIFYMLKQLGCISNK